MLSSSGVYSSDSSLSSNGSPVQTKGQNEGISKDVYLSGSFVTMEEDQTCEFKGHCSISVEEISPDHKDGHSGRFSRAPISRALCGFLNSRLGGTIYLGLLDSGRVKGIAMSPAQMEHFMCNLEDTLERFSPPVPLNRIEVRFVPVLLSKNETASKTAEVRPLRHTPGHVHKLRTFEPCWCVTEQRCLFRSGVLAPSFVVELHTRPWTGVGLHPIFQNEECYSYTRGHGGQAITALSQLLLRARTETKDVIQEELAVATKKLEQLKLKATAKGIKL